MKSTNVTSIVGYGATLIMPLTLLFAVNPENMIGYNRLSYVITMHSLWALYFTVGVVFGAKNVKHKWIYPLFSGTVWAVAISLFFSFHTDLISALIFFVQFYFPALLGLFVGLIVMRVRRVQKQRKQLSA
jgi:hypothetical protein